MNTTSAGCGRVPAGVSVRTRQRHLASKGIRLGPSLPAFITPNVLQVLVDTFDIKPITTPDADLKAILG